jgi:hypothetical protein
MLLLGVGLLLPFLFGGGAAATSLGAAPSTTIGVPPSLQITHFTADPSEFVASNSTVLNVTVAGGAPPYTFVYTGLPQGCRSANVSELDCLPQALGGFDVTVTVTDTAGATASNTTRIIVTSGYAGPPVINGITVAPDPVGVGQVSEIDVNAVSVSHSTLAFFYFDLPPGCASFNQTPLECLPSAPGSYYIGVEVTDAFGQPVIGHAYVNVTGSASPGHTDAATPLPNYLLYGVPVAVILLAVAVGAFLFRRPRRPRGPPTAYRVPPKP